ncbi:MAG: adenine-specific methylase [Pseudomonadota bacterium]
MRSKMTKQGVKPLLKWAGGKRWLVPLLLAEVWPLVADRRWVEPFVGGMAIPFGLNPRKTLLNDINIHLINFYQQVKKGLKIKQVLKNEAVYYYEMRDQFNDLVGSHHFCTPKGAILFYYLLKTGFNGLCRFNKQGFFNVPFGQHPHLQYRTDFLDYQDVLSQWHFECQDFEALDLNGDEIIYADPPYDVEFTQYYANRFEWSDQVRLANWLSGHKGPVIASNQATDRIMTLYRQQGFKVFTLPAPRRVACNGDRKSALEILACKGLSRRVLSRIESRLVSY